MPAAMPAGLPAAGTCWTTTARVRSTPLETTSEGLKGWLGKESSRVQPGHLIPVKRLFWNCLAEVRHRQGGRRGSWLPDLT